VALAQVERVSPLLDYVLRARPDTTVPDEAEELLRSDYSEAVLNSLRREAAMISLCQALGEETIPALLLKGAGLAISCYDDPATRLMGDLDLLVPHQCSDAAADCLEGHGFRPHAGSLAAARRSDRSHLIFVHSPTEVVVELHWELKLLGRVERKAVAEIWAAAEPAAVATGPLVMRLCHALPLHAAHALLQHREAPLLWLYDLHRITLKMDEAEARAAQDVATGWRLGPCTALALLRVHELFGTPLPGELADWARRMAARRDLQTRIAAQALARDTQEAPSEYLISFLQNRTYSPLRILCPTPDDLRARLSLPPDARVGISEYTTFLTRRLRNAPLHLRQLRDFWRTSRPRQSTNEPSTPHTTDPAASDSTT
jgi:hypothetical protein